MDTTLCAPSSVPLLLLLPLCTSFPHRISWGVQVKSSGFRKPESKAWQQDPLTGWEVQVPQKISCWHLSPAVLTPRVQLLFFPSTERDVSHMAKGHRRATGTRTLYSGKVSCCFFNFLSGKWNTFQQKVGKDLEQNWSWLSKHLTTFCGKQPSVLGDINSRRYWWH